MLDPEVFTRLPALAMTTSRLPVRCDDRANGIVASVTGALGLRDGQLHELLFRFVGSRDHVGRENLPLGGKSYYYN